MIAALHRAAARRRQALLAAMLALCGFAGFAGAAQIHQIAQRNREFSQEEITIATGDTIRFTNEDEFLHQIFVSAPGFTFDSAEQPPGQVIEVRFPVPGTYTVLCHIHPKMHLTVRVR
jgi:plastocyanin